MTFSNPAGHARATGGAYIQLLLETLGDRDPWTVSAATPDNVERAVAGLGEDVVRRPEKPGKWSLAEVVQHLADSDLVFGYRVRMIISHPIPDIQAFDQDLWAKELEYGVRRIKDALDELRSLRQSNLRLLGSISPAKLDRYGNHSERGEESVLRMVKLYAGHDLVHLKQIERIRRAVTGAS